MTSFRILQLGITYISSLYLMFLITEKKQQKKHKAKELFHCSFHNILDECITLIKIIYNLSAFSSTWNLALIKGICRRIHSLHLNLIFDVTLTALLQVTYNNL